MMTVENIGNAAGCLILIGIMIGTLVIGLGGCSDTDRCQMHSDKLGIDMDACQDPAVAAKAVKVLEQKKASAKTDAEKRLDEMLNPGEPSHVAAVAAKLRKELNKCRADLNKAPQPCVCSDKAESIDDWKNSR